MNYEPSNLPYGHPAWVEGYLIPMGELDKEERDLEYRIKLALQKQRMQESNAPSHQTIEEWAVRLNEVRADKAYLNNLYHPEPSDESLQETDQELSVSLEKEFAFFSKHHRSN